MKKLIIFTKSLWPFLLILIFCLWAIKPLFVPGFFTIHDDEQIARLFEMSKVLGQGQIPPRWVPDLGFGFGYPLYNFYPPLVYYFGALFHAIGFSLIISTKFVIGFGFFFSGIFMYLWTKNRFGILAGLFAAFLYIYSPYHSVDIYVRGALSEFFSFVFIPGVFWSLDRLAKKPKITNLILSAVMLCLVVLTHTLVMLQFAPFLGVYILFLLWEQRKSFKKLLPYIIAFGILGFGLSAYFAIPSLLEKQYTLVDSILVTQLANYSIHFVCPSQFWNSLWGYGGSASGCLDGLSFQVGKIQLLVVVLSLLGIVWMLLKKQKNILLPFVTVILFAFTLFIATNYSKFIWDAIQPWWYIQFPWRFLLFSAIFSSLLGGYVISLVQNHWKTIGGVTVMIVLGCLAFYQIRNDFHPQTYLPVGDNYYLENQDIEWRVSRLSYEYVPKQVATRLSALQTTELAIDKNDIPTKPFTVLSGQMKVNVEKNDASNKQVEVSVSKPGILQINTYSFPGWKIFVNNQQITYNDANKLHVMQVPLSQGQNSISIAFTNTLIRTISNVISLLSLVTCLVLLLLQRRFGK